MIHILACIASYAYYYCYNEICQTTANVKAWAIGPGPMMILTVKWDSLISPSSQEGAVSFNT